MRTRIFWTGFYALLMSCFFFTGVYFADHAWAGFLVLPFVLSILYGYFRKAIGGGFLNMAAGLVLYGFVVAILLCILSTFEPFWVYLENLKMMTLGNTSLVWGWEITTVDEAVAVAAMAFVGVFMLQIGLGILGVLVGIGTEKLFGGILQPPKERALEQPTTHAVIR